MNPLRLVIRSYHNIGSEVRQSFCDIVQWISANHFNSIKTLTEKNHQKSSGK